MQHFRAVGPGGVSLQVIEQDSSDTTKGNTRVTVTDSKALKAMLVTPSDSTDLTNGVTKGIYIGVSGDLKVTMSDGNTVTFVGISNGVIHPISAKRIWAAGTTATSVLAVY